MPNEFRALSFVLGGGNLKTLKWHGRKSNPTNAFGEIVWERERGNMWFIRLMVSFMVFVVFHHLGLWTPSCWWRTDNGKISTGLEWCCYAKRMVEPGVYPTKRLSGSLHGWSYLPNLAKCCSKAEIDGQLAWFHGGDDSVVCGTLFHVLVQIKKCTW